MSTLSVPTQCGCWLALALIVSACASSMTEKEDETFSSYVRLGISYISQNNFDSAENALQRAASINDDDYRLTHAYALLAQFRGDRKLADKLFQQTLEENPDFTRARNNYGVFLSTLDRDPEALEQFNLAAGDTSYNRREIAYENIADVAIKINQPLQAIAALRKAREVNPGETGYSLRLAHLLAQQEQYEPALEYFHDYLDLLSRSNRAPLAKDMQLGMVIADRLGNRDLVTQYRSRMIVLEELESTQSQ